MPKKSPLAYWFNAISGLLIVILAVVGTVVIILRVLNATGVIAAEQQTQQSVTESTATTP